MVRKQQQHTIWPRPACMLSFSCSSIRACTSLSRSAAFFVAMLAAAGKKGGTIKVDQGKKRETTEATQYSVQKVRSK